jgi:nucleoid-associated protein YgaU
MATLNMIDAIGADMPSGFAPAHTFLYNKPYIVVTGDTLSKIALKFYGYENLWDIIWLDSGADFHPDKIVPGQKLSLP